MKTTMKYFLAFALSTLFTTACSSNKKAEAAADDPSAEEVVAATSAAEGKTLVVFFSHAGDNYSVGDVPVGNTKIVADYISELTGADQFEIVTHKYDGMAYQPLCDLAKAEQENGELPDFEGTIDNLDDYQTVFVGSPVWWGTFPQVVFSFFKKYDLNGKTLIPFITHEGSGLAHCAKHLQEAYPEATVKGEFAIYGHDVREGKATVEKWLQKLGYAK